MLVVANKHHQRVVLRGVVMFWRRSGGGKEGVAARPARGSGDVAHAVDAARDKAGDAGQDAQSGNQ